MKQAKAVIYFLHMDIIMYYVTLKIIFITALHSTVDILEHGSNKMKDINGKNVASHSKPYICPYYHDAF